MDGLRLLTHALPRLDFVPDSMNRDDPGTRKRNSRELETIHEHSKFRKIGLKSYLQIKFKFGKSKMCLQITIIIVVLAGAHLTSWFILFRKRME